MAEEESKFGIKAEEAEGLIKEIAALENVSVKGLMTVAPFVEDPATFELCDKCAKKLERFLREDE